MKSSGVHPCCLIELHSTGGLCGLCFLSAVTRGEGQLQQHFMAALQLQPGARPCCPACWQQVILALVCLVLPYLLANLLCTTVCCLCLLQLPLGTLVYMLNRFQPDDFSREGIPYDVLQELKSEAVAAGAGDGSTAPMLEVEAECTYYSPTDDMAMEKVMAGGLG